MDLHDLSDPSAPSPAEVALAKESSRVLSALPLNDEPISADFEGIRVRIPAAAMRVLLKALAKMGRGHAVTTIALAEELSEGEAAVLLNVSESFLTKLLDQDAIPSRRVGSHRRLLTRDLLAYKQRRKAARLEVLAELSAQTQELGMGY